MASPEQLAEVLRVLYAANDYQDRAGMQQAIDYLAQTSGDPNVNNCLSLIAANKEQAAEPRIWSAYRLKENIRRSFDNGVKPAVEVIKPRLAECLSDPNPTLQRAVVACVTEVAKVCTSTSFAPPPPLHSPSPTPTQARSWPTLVMQFWPMLQHSQDANFRRGVLTVIKDVCEDCGDALEEKQGAECQADLLIPELLKIIISKHDPTEMLLCLQSCGNLLQYESRDPNTPIYRKFEVLLPQLLQALQLCVELSRTAGQMGQELLGHALTCYKQTLYYYDQLKAANQVQGMLSLLSQCSIQTHGEVALRACEFWFELPNHPAALDDVRQFGILPQLCELLLNHMVMSEMEIATVEEEEQAEQVKPVVAAKKGDDDDSPVEQWTLRTCTAATLDLLATQEQAALVSPPGKEAGWLLLNQIVPRLQSPDWKQRESAVLALGCIAEGCFQAVEPHLAQAIPILLSWVEAAETEYLLKSISFWTLGRYVRFISEHKPLFERFLQSLLAGMTHARRNVQQSAVAAVAVLLQHESETQGLIHSDSQYLTHILEKVKYCLEPGKFTLRNQVILFQVVSQLVTLYTDEASSALGQECIFRPLIQQHLLNLPHTEQIVLPALLSHLSPCIYAMQERFFPYVDITFNKCLTIVGKYFEAQSIWAQTKTGPEPDLGTAHLHAIDVVKALVSVAAEKSPDQARSLLMNSKYPGTDYTFVTFTLLPITQSQLDVDEYTSCQVLDFLGDNLGVFPDLFVQPCLQNIQTILNFMDEDTYLAKDAAWFCGEMVTTLHGKLPPDQLNQLITMLATKMVPILVQVWMRVSPHTRCHTIPLQKTKWDEELLQHFALTIGKFGRADPTVLAPQLGNFFVSLVTRLGDVCDDSPFIPFLSRRFPFPTTAAHLHSTRRSTTAAKIRPRRSSVSWT